MLYSVKYHTLLTEKRTYQNSPDQASMGIGDAIVAGFTAERYAFEDREGRKTTAIAVIASSGLMVGVYEFTKVA